MADMKLNRRTLLQRAGLALLSLGIGETGIGLVPRIKSYGQALAQTTNRKLALLVGVNDYSQHQLDGCVTDVELQQELLINRFGFNAKDIVTLTNQQATRENIETAFIEHLREQAQPEDVVVFHFSGYGSQVKMLSSDIVTNQAGETVANYQLVNSLLPIDGIVPTKGTPVGNDLLQETLIWLARSLPTEKVTMVLDTSFKTSKQSLKGNLRIRSFSEIAERPSPEEIAFREQLQIKLAGKKSKSVNPGIILTAASQEQIAVEKRWNNFSAGLFTYALTQYLWEVTAPNRVQVTLERITETVKDVMGNQQQPTILGQSQPLFTYYLMPTSLIGAEGIIKNIGDNGSVSLKLMGLPTKIVDYYGVTSCLLVGNSNDSTSFDQLTIVQIRSRDGLMAKAQILHQGDVLNNIKIGQLVQEYIRVIPRNVGLIVGLDRSLERIERVDATSAFANIAVVDGAISVGEPNVDCLFGKIERTVSKTVATKSDSNQGESETSTTTYFGYGLSSVSGITIPHTVGVANEAVKSAVTRLTPQFKNLLAVKWLELTFNQTSSRLPVGIFLESIDKNNTSLILQRSTRAAKLLNQLASQDLSLNSTNFPTINSGSSLRLQLNNYTDRTLYGIVLGIDADRNLFVLYPPQYNSKEEQFKLQDIAIAPSQKLNLPETQDAWQWKIAGSSGMVSLYGIFSTLPFKQTLAAISAPPNLKFESEAILNLANALEVTKALMEDLHLASQVDTEIIGFANDVYALDVNVWATLKMSWELVNN
ncbi:peptidase C14 caspase catalytic subunit p20 [Stanieria sp. NIES-3757]|nr:peptidase C14 caspase catalytic subunit p20 [Stanieria sp. NIES-3757]